MPTRLEQLQKMLDREPTDTFLLYGIAMEYKKASNNQEALTMLDRVTNLDSGHGYAFFQRGQILESNGDLVGAKKAYEDGVLAAQKSGDSHARSELQGALEQLL